MRERNNGLWTVNIILLGLLMLVSGLMKIFVTKPEGVTQTLSAISLFSWAPMFWAWVLILGEVLSGIAIITRWKLRYSSIIPVIILSVAVITVTIKWQDISSTSWTSVIFHLIAIVNYLMISRFQKD